MVLNPAPAASLPDGIADHRTRTTLGREDLEMFIYDIPEAARGKLVLIAHDAQLIDAAKSLRAQLEKS